jgi:hypothetical protein
MVHPRMVSVTEDIISVSRTEEDVYMHRTGPH